MVGMAPLRPSRLVRVSWTSKVLALVAGGTPAEPHVQPLMKLNATVKRPWVRHDWSEGLLRAVARWANRYGWRYGDFAAYARGRKLAIPA